MALFLAFLLLNLNVLLCFSFGGYDFWANEVNLTSDSSAINEIPSVPTISVFDNSSNQLRAKLSREVKWWNTFRENTMTEMKRIDRSMSSIIDMIQDKMRSLSGNKTDFNLASMANASSLTPLELMNGAKKVVQDSFNAAQDLAYQVPVVSKDKISDLVKEATQNLTMNSSTPGFNLTQVILNTNGSDIYSEVKNKTSESFDLSNDIAEIPGKLIVNVTKENIKTTKSPRFMGGFPFFFRVFHNGFF